MLAGVFCFLERKRKYEPARKRGLKGWDDEQRVYPCKEIVKDGQVILNGMFRKLNLNLLPESRVTGKLVLSQAGESEAVTNPPREREQRNQPSGASGLGLPVA